MYDYKENRRYYIRIGICPKCKKRKPESGYKLCSQCRMKNNICVRRCRAKKRGETDV